MFAYFRHILDFIWDLLERSFKGPFAENPDKMPPANNESYIPWKEIVAVTFDTKNIMPIDPVFRVLSEKQG